MKRFVTVCAAVGAGMLLTGFAMAADVQYDISADPPLPVASNDQPGYASDSMTAYLAEADKKESNAKKDDKSADDHTANVTSNCGCQASCCGSEAPSCSSETGCCSSCGCCNDNWCDLGLDQCWPFYCCCKPGTPCTLEKCLTPCCTDVTYGGFFEVGTYTQNTGLSAFDGDHLDTHDYPGHLQLSQAYFYIEKKAKTDSCCCDWGYRWDILYGSEGWVPQAFGNQNNGWDKSWDHGEYGWAMPQAYAELGWNDWSIKIGHFYTPNAYEVIPANGNFFYSHALTWFNSEPFTHTGILATKTVDPCFSYFCGWTLGWDTAFDNFDGGNNYLGGFTYKINNNVTFIYGLTAGNLGFRSDGEFGYNHSIVIDDKLSSKWEYVLESDLVETDGSFGGNGVTNDGEDYGVTNYLFYTINDCWKMGSRLEWWKSNQVTGQDTSFYELTYGFNYKPGANWIVRPEVRYDWSPAENAVINAPGQNGNFYDKVEFGIDAICTF